ncbi:FHA domain-containing protein [bacterium]|nr:FHA domain-containing protein [bacterium]
MSLDGAYQVEVIEGEDTGAVLDLVGDSIKLGAGEFTALEDGTLTIKDKNASSLIAVLHWEEENKAYRISNRSAFSPVVVNGEPCENALLVSGTTIQVGKSLIEIVSTSDITPVVGDIAKIDPTSNEPVYLGELPEEEVDNTNLAWLERGDGEEQNESTVYDLAEEEDSESEFAEAQSTEADSDYIPSPEEAAAYVMGEMAKQEQGYIREAADYVASKEAEEQTNKEIDLFGATTFISAQSDSVEEEFMDDYADDYDEDYDDYLDEEDYEAPIGRISVIKGDNRGRTLEIFGDFTIGRSPDNDFVLTDPQVSRHHCSVRFTDKGVILLNHSNSSTTRINNYLIKLRGQLKNNSIITLANKVSLRWESFLLEDEEV